MATVSPHGVASTGLSLLCLPPGHAWDREGDYLGSVHQPPGVQQAEAVLVAVAEAGLVDVPLGVTILVLKKKGRAHLLPWGTRAALQTQSKGVERKKLRNIPQQQGSKPTRPY